MRIDIELHTATNRKTECHWLVVGGVRMLVSYSTVMAFIGPNGRFRRQHHISRTTARHMSETGVSGYPRATDDEQFEKLLQHALCEGIHPMLAPVALLGGEVS